jgi:hypothetical protein
MKKEKKGKGEEGRRIGFFPYALSLAIFSSHPLTRVVGQSMFVFVMVDEDGKYFATSVNLLEGCQA